MARKKISSMLKVATELAGGSPLGYHQRDDGSLVVIDPAGRKLIFTAEEVRNVDAKLDDEGAK